MRSIHALRAQDRTGGTVWRAAALLTLTLLLFGGASASQAAVEDQPSDGCFVTPSIGCVWGEHKLDLSLTTRLRAEYWRARTSSNGYLLRGADPCRPQVLVRQPALRLRRVPGRAALQPLTQQQRRRRALPGVRRGETTPTARRIRQLWLDVKPIEGLGIRIGRQDIKLGTEVMYPEAQLEVRQDQARLPAPGGNRGLDPCRAEQRRHPSRLRHGGTPPLRLRRPADHGCLRHQGCLQTAE